MVGPAGAGRGSLSAKLANNLLYFY